MNIRSRITQWSMRLTWVQYILGISHWYLGRESQAQQTYSFLTSQLDVNYSGIATIISCRFALCQRVNNFNLVCIIITVLCAGTFSIVQWNCFSTRLPAVPTLYCKLIVVAYIYITGSNPIRLPAGSTIYYGLIAVPYIHTNGTSPIHARHPLWV